MNDSTWTIRTATDLERAVTRLGRQLGRLEDDLRELADDVALARKRIEAPVPSHLAEMTEAPTASIIREIQHDILWGFANLNFDHLTEAAAIADVLRAKEASNAEPS